MKMTNAERQARYRQRHLGSDGDKMRLTICLSHSARLRLERLAHNKGCSVTALVEDWAENAGLENPELFD